jgi:hypothetical protein
MVRQGKDLFIGDLSQEFDYKSDGCDALAVGDYLLLECVGGRFIVDDVSGNASLSKFSHGLGVHKVEVSVSPRWFEHAFDSFGCTVVDDVISIIVDYACSPPDVVPHQMDRALYLREADIGVYFEGCGVLRDVFVDWKHVGYTTFEGTYFHLMPIDFNGVREGAETRSIMDGVVTDLDVVPSFLYVATKHFNLDVQIVDSTFDVVEFGGESVCCFTPGLVRPSFRCPYRVQRLGRVKPICDVRGTGDYGSGVFPLYRRPYVIVQGFDGSYPIVPKRVSRVHSFGPTINVVTLITEDLYFSVPVKSRMSLPSSHYDALSPCFPPHDFFDPDVIDFFSLDGRHHAADECYYDFSDDGSVCTMYFRGMSF